MGTTKRVLLWVMGVFYVFAGVMHFVTPDFYLKIMPDYLPWHLGLVYLSGFCEVALGLLVLIPVTTTLAAWGLIALLIAVFPANIHQAVHHIQVGATPASPVLLWLRLPFQAVFIAWAWWYTRRPLLRRRNVPRPS